MSRRKVLVSTPRLANRVFCGDLHPNRSESSRLREELDRRVVLAGGAAAASVGPFALILGAVTAFIGRVIGGTTNSKTTTANPGAPPRSTAPPARRRLQVQRRDRLDVGVLGPVGQALSFTNAADGSPAWVVHPASDTFVAFSAICSTPAAQSNTTRPPSISSVPAMAASTTREPGRTCKDHHPGNYPQPRSTSLTAKSAPTDRSMRPLVVLSRLTSPLPRGTGIVSVWPFTVVPVRASSPPGAPTRC